jgi:hypothetical protein
MKHCQAFEQNGKLAPKYDNSCILKHITLLKKNTEFNNDTSAFVLTTMATIERQSLTRTGSCKWTRKWGGKILFANAISV